MSANLYAEIKGQKILIHLADKTEFELVPYTKTPDGDQQFFGIDEHLERIVLCINDLAPVPTETIKLGFAGRMMATVDNAKKSVETARRVLGTMYGKEAKEQKAKDQTDTSSIPAETT